MATRAQVSSVEAIEAFRSALIVYLAKARPVVEEAASDLRRAQYWLDNDQRLHWERESRRRARALEETQQALLSARMSSFRGALASEQMAVQRARLAMSEAEEKMRLLRRWSREFGPLTQPLARPVDRLDTILAQDMSQAVVFLTEIIRHLEAYASTRLEPAPAPASPTTDLPTDTPPPTTDAGTSPNPPSPSAPNQESGATTDNAPP